MDVRIITFTLMVLLMGTSKPAKGNATKYCGINGAFDTVNALCKFDVKCENNIDEDIETNIKNNECYKEHAGKYEINFEATSINDEENFRLLKKFSRNIGAGKIMSTNLKDDLDTIYSQFVNAKSISISKCTIKHVNLQKICNTLDVEEISFANNLISRLDKEINWIKDNTTLKVIVLSNNKLKEIPDIYFEHFNVLSTLDLSHNELKKISLLSVQGLSQLEILSLSHNYLENIDQTFSRFENLKELYLDHNQIMDFKSNSFIVMIHLKKLYLNDNRLIKLQDELFNTLNDLEELDLSNNNIQKISNLLFEKNSKLTKLNLQNNQIIDVGQESFKYNAINDFTIAGNSLQSCSKLSKGLKVNKLNFSFQKLQQIEAGCVSELDRTLLTELTFKNNSIVNIDEKAFDEMTALVILDLSHNHIKNIQFHTNSLGSLKNLDLSYNNIDNIKEDTLKHLKVIENFDISYNNISDLKGLVFDNLTEIKIIKLNNNPLQNHIEKNKFKNCKMVTYLNLSNSHLEKIDENAFSGMRSLTTLDVSYCQLSNINSKAFNDTGSIMVLDLSYNFLNEFIIRASEFKKLQTLKLQYNNITSMKEDSLALEYLENLDLSYNDIKVVGPKHFASMKHIKNIDLSANKNLEIDSGTFNNLNLETLLLKEIKKISFKDAVDISIAKLDVSSCKIKDISTLSLNNINNIRVLDLSNNHISLLESDAFGGLGSLTSIDLSRNSIQSLPERLFVTNTLLEYIYLNGNALKYLEKKAFEGLNHLKILNLSNNNLKKIDASSLPSTNDSKLSLILDNNTITHLPFEDFKGLRLLSIDNNPISCDEIAIATNKVSYLVIPLQVERFCRKMGDNEPVTSLNLIPNSHKTHDDIIALPNYCIIGSSLSIHKKICMINITCQNAVDDNIENTIKNHTCYKENNYEIILKATSIAAKTDLMSLIPNLQSHIRSAHITDGYMRNVNLQKICSALDVEEISFANNLISRLDKEINWVQNNTKLKVIVLSNNKLKEIPDIYFEHFNGLSTLDLSHNEFKKISLLSVQGLNQLEILSLSYNYLENIDQAFSRFENLKELYLDHNQIMDLTLHSFIVMIHLKKLYLNDNRLIKLQNEIFNTLNDLEELDLSNNNIQKISNLLFEKNLKLTKLNLQNNQIIDVGQESFKYNAINDFTIAGNSLQSCSKLSKGLKVNKLNFSFQKLQQIEAGCVSELDRTLLTELTFKNNSIVNIDEKAFDEMTALVILDLSHNHIKNIQFHTNSLGSLKNLDLSYNNIDNIKEDTLKHLKVIENFDISYNNISDLKGLVFDNLTEIKIIKLNNNPLQNHIEKNKFKNCKKVTYLNLSNSHLEKIDENAFSGMRSLTTLDVSYCQLSNINSKAFDDTGSIMVLDLSYNFLTEFIIRASEFKKLQTLKLQYNNITSMKEDSLALEHLENLDLSYNDIKFVGPKHFASMRHIKNINLSANKNLEIGVSTFNNLNLETLLLKEIKKISFKDAVDISIAKLDVSSCKIKDISTLSLNNINNIRVLDLSNNHISLLESDAFGGLGSLTSIDLSRNYIQSLPERLFVTTTLLEYIYLNGNALKYLEKKAFEGLNHLKILNLSNNNLKKIDASSLPSTDDSKLSFILDNNTITHLPFEDFKGLSFISIDNNPMLCADIENAKTKFALRIVPINTEKFCRKINDGITHSTTSLPNIIVENNSINFDNIEKVIKLEHNKTSELFLSKYDRKSTEKPKTEEGTNSYKTLLWVAALSSCAVFLIIIIKLSHDCTKQSKNIT